LLAESLHPESVLVANEYDRKRYQILEEHIIKFGVENAILFNAPVQRLQDILPPVDLLVIDAPCSGEGMMRKDMFARKQWTPQLVRHCQNMQTDILKHATDLLKEDGYLIYSTCTFNKEENDLHYDRLMNIGCIPVEIPGLEKNGWDKTNEKYIYKALPHKVKGEGLSFFVHQKKNTSTYTKKKKVKKKIQSLNIGNIHHKIPASIQEYLSGISSIQDVKWAGIGDHIIKGKTQIPHIHQGKKAWQAYPLIDLDKIQALQYLSGQDLRMEQTTQGWLSVMYQSQFLGFAKAVGTRLSNHYPKHWRIRHLPKDLTDLEA